MHPCHGVANSVETKFVCVIGNQTHFGATRTEQVNNFLLAQFLAVAMSFNDFSNATTREWARMRHQRHGLGVGTRIPLRGLMPNKNNFSSVENNVGSSDFLWPEGTWVIATQAFSISAVHHSEVECRVEPLVWVKNKLRVNRESWCKCKAAVFGDIT